MSKAYHSAFGGAPYYQSGRGEMAPFSPSNKADGNENKSGKISPYLIKIDFGNDGEFFGRATVLRRDYHWRALSVSALKQAIRQTFPDVRFSFQLSRSAQLASDPSTILQGRV